MLKNSRKILQHFIHILYIVILTTMSCSVSAQDIEHYKLGADDVISVNVFDEPELSLKEIRISSTGTIAMPLIGQIKVRGLSITEAEKTIYDLYFGDYLKNPDISISIVEYRQFYVNGEVQKPGGYGFREGMTVERAITLAGGFSERASKTNILIVREGSYGEPIKADLNTPVRPGDVITIEESFF